MRGYRNLEENMGWVIWVSNPTNPEIRVGLRISLNPTSLRTYWPSLRSFVNRHDDQSIIIMIGHRRSRCSPGDIDVRSCRSPMIKIIDHWWSRQSIINGQDDLELMIKRIQSQRSRQSTNVDTNQSRSRLVMNYWYWSRSKFVANGHPWSLIWDWSEFFS